jgi:hypothetical protein
MRLGNHPIYQWHRLSLVSKRLDSNPQRSHDHDTEAATFVNCPRKQGGAICFRLDRLSAIFEHIKPVKRNNPSLLASSNFFALLDGGAAGYYTIHRQWPHQ